ncbi:hypothetical protein EP7_003834 [Isosphaeraceae bacterium EP7]
MPDIHLARFQVDATPPIGHPLCGGWIKPVVGVDDPLWLRGIVLQGAGDPIVLASLDWTGLMNESHRLWVETLAKAAHTSPDRVALHCVHQHNAPFVDRDGNALLKKAGATQLISDDGFVEALMERSAASVRDSIVGSKPIDRVRVGHAEVKQVACNRRVIGQDGKIRFTRTSSTTDPAARAEPEGVIDPILRSISFGSGDRTLARLYYYTTHPMSYYGDGRVTSDFVGLARARRDADEPETQHLYFTGSAGNVTAGKYNDGSKPMRAILTDRVHAAMVAADAGSQSHPLEKMSWTTSPVDFTSREDLDLDALKAIVANSSKSVVDRNRSAMTCGWLMRAATKRPILLSRLDLGSANLLHLPAETFVEYQLAAQAAFGATPLAVAAYGDGGPWYIPLRKSYGEGGYEPSVSFVSPSTEPEYRKLIWELLKRQ